MVEPKHEAPDVEALAPEYEDELDRLEQFSKELGLWSSPGTRRRRRNMDDPTFRGRARRDL